MLELGFALKHFLLLLIFPLLQLPRFERVALQFDFVRLCVAASPG